MADTDKLQLSDARSERSSLKVQIKTTSTRKPETAKREKIITSEDHQ